jgi:ribA/ribD-fused uncharacterized protein
MPERHPDHAALSADAGALDELMLSGFEETVTNTYRRSRCATFRKTHEEFGGLSNMAAGFPLWVNGIEIRTSEAIYQAARYPHMPEVQREILAQASPMGAKMKSKPHRRESRPDFDALRVPIIWWSLRIKLACNPTSFAKLLSSTGTRAIVEDSHRDRYWGAVPDAEDQSVLRGANVLGRLLVLLREVVGEFDPPMWQVVPPPLVSGFTLLREPVGVVDGTRLPMAARSRPMASRVPVSREPATVDNSKARTFDALCPTCFIVLPASGRCDNCS